MGAVGGMGLQEFGPQAQGLVGGVAHAEHPLVAADRADTAAHLVGQRLEGQAMIGGRQGAGDGVAGASGLLHGQEMVNGLFKPSAEQVFVAGKRDERA